MTDRTAGETVAQAIDDFDSIKKAIEGHKINVPYPTKTSEYAELIANIRVGSVSGFANSSFNLADTETVCGFEQQTTIGRVNTTIIGNAVCVSDENEV